MAPGPAAMEQLACRPHQRCHSGCAGAVPHAEAAEVQQETRAAITQEDHYPAKAKTSRTAACCS